MTSIGTALLHAYEHALPADILVEGHWLHGRVARIDGFGVLLVADNGLESVIRVESVAAVTVGDPVPGPDVLVIGEQRNGAEHQLRADTPA
ncbi:MAG: hypothetical protein ACXVXC_17215 [Nocardioidaceae bacterium]